MLEILLMFKILVMLEISELRGWEYSDLGGGINYLKFLPEKFQPGIPLKVKPLKDNDLLFYSLCFQKTYKNQHHKTKIHIWKSKLLITC